MPDATGPAADPIDRQDEVARDRRRVRLPVGGPEGPEAAGGGPADDLFRSLRRLAGRTYRWESSAQELPAYLKLRGVPPPGSTRRSTRGRLCWWAEDAGLDVGTAATAVGMSPSTARGSYLAMDQEKAAAKRAEDRRPA